MYFWFARGVQFGNVVHVWLYVWKSKGDCFEKFEGFKALIEMQSENAIKTFRSDNGGEFVYKPFNQILKDHGIEKQTSTPL